MVTLTNYSISQDFCELESYLESQINEESSELISSIARHIICAGGKRLRPQILILLAKLFDCTTSCYIKIAAVVELIHTATLLHDDVIDNSHKRRNRPSAHVKWGTRNAIISGDWLFALAFDITTSINNLRLTKIIADMTNKMSLGELEQLAYIDRSYHNKQAYMEIIEAKTGLLFAATCELAAVVANQPEDQVNQAKMFGLHLGLAFQIKDDLLDYLGDEASLGKNIGDDLLEGKLTLPLIYLKERNKKKFNFLTSQLKNKSLEPKRFRVCFFELNDLLLDHGCIDDTLMEAEGQQQKALSYLEQLPKNIYWQELYNITEQVLERVT